MRFIGFLLALGLFVSSCESPQSKECTEDVPVPEQEGSVSHATGDSLIETQEKPAKFVKEKQENHRKIVQKYGEQWDFCACVVANDSINKASQGGLTEKQAERLMKRWEYIETRCKEFMTHPNTTPDERAIHERKVAKCLKKA